MTRPLLSLLLLGSALSPHPAGARSPAPAAAQRSCTEPAKLVVPPAFRDPRGTFAPAGRNFRTLEARFASAYRLVCRSPARAPLPAGPLLLRNAPDANTTSIYRDGEGGDGAGSGAMVMEHPYIGHGGRVDIPSVEELRSALVCSVYNSDPPGRPEEEILECLPD